MISKSDEEAHEMFGGPESSRRHSPEVGRNPEFEATPEILESIGLAVTLWRPYMPMAHCPECECAMLPQEIMDGFMLDDQYDYTTECVNCGHRFEATFEDIARTTKVNCIFYCPLQAVAKLEKLPYLTRSEMAAKDPGLFRSCILHFGSLRSAYAAAEMRNYPYIERSVKGWREKVAPFMDSFSNERIAQLANVQPRTVARFRKSLKV